jgi:hypothetical protein
MTPFERTIHIVAINQLIARFYDCLDGGRHEELLHLIAPDGTWLRRNIVLQGRDAVREALRQRPVTVTTRQAVSNLIVGFPAQDRAEATYYLTAFHHDAEATPTLPVPMDHPLHVARYVVKLTAHENDWLIHDLRGVSTFRRG